MLITPLELIPDKTSPTMSATIALPNTTNTAFATFVIAHPDAQ
jgi:hypothetical protein